MKKLLIAVAVLALLLCGCKSAPGNSGGSESATVSGLYNHVKLIVPETGVKSEYYKALPMDDGGFVVLGSRTDSQKGFGYILDTYDGDGILTGSKALDFDTVFGIYPAGDGGFLIAVSTYKSDFTQVTYAKLDKNLEEVWTKIIPGDFNDFLNPVRLAGGDYVFSAYEGGATHLVVTDAGLNIKKDLPLCAMMDPTYHPPCTVAAAPDGGFFVAGDFDIYNPMVNEIAAACGKGGRDGFLARYTADETLLWVKGFGGSADDLAETIA
ncbi:MAG: hypothetical protein FWF49_05525, partial [Oscillospiraceae bacterium]|nr:hypothetical protein [Oscillospiraceae bacterium]